MCIRDSIYIRIERGMSPKEAGIEGAKEIFFAVISTSITPVSYTHLVARNLVDAVVGEARGFDAQTVVGLLLEGVAGQRVDVVAADLRCV